MNNPRFWRTMSDTFKILGTLVLIILFVVGLGVAVVHQRESHHAQIRQWAKDNHYEVVGQINRQGFWESSPFWFTDDDDSVYKVPLAGREGTHTSWFRFRFWGMDQAWKD